jgi:hypothetical protein
VKHRSAPDERLVARIEEADGDDAEAVALDGDDAIFAGDTRSFFGTHHEGNVGAVDIGIEETDLVAEAREGEREIDGDGGFADASLAGADGDDGVDAVDGLRSLLLLAGMRMLMMCHGSSL